jgi:hypothetical protein
MRVKDSCDEALVSHTRAVIFFDTLSSAYFISKILNGFR